MPPSEHPRVFISYARSDGSDYAAWLRRKLQKEHRDIELWQDIISERSGRDWWLQITEALDHVAYMVMVATPDALKSDGVREEWRYARQRGVCVLPVQASGALNFDSLPRWMKTKHFADLKTEPQWVAFVAELRRECVTPRVPFMADDLSEDFVKRPEQFEPIVQLLVNQQREQRNPVAITTALRGAGGFGKTTLAKAVCHDPRIQEAFDDGILWVTLGEKVDNLPGKVADLTRTLSGEVSDFGSLEPAKSRLRELLAERDILMVIDDVWDAAHLEPFLQGGPHCARLITTRNLDTLPEKSSDVKVDSMQPDEAAELLGAGLPADCKPQMIALAERVGNWPLLLGMVKSVLQERIKTAKQPPADAIAYVNKALDKRGLTAFDPRNTKARNRAVELTVDASLETFSLAERERLQEMSIFPEDVDIPLKVAETLWEATANLDEFDVEELCVRLHSRSLLQLLDLAVRYLRVHDVMRTYLETQLAQHRDPKLVHGKLVDAWGDPHKLPNIYAWLWYGYHLGGAGRWSELRDLLFDPDWLQAKLFPTDVNALIADFGRLPDDESLRVVQGAIRLSANVIASDPGQFSSQMVGRLLPYQEEPVIGEFTKRVAEGTQAPWLRPLQPALHPPGTALVRTLAGHTSSVNGVALSGDGRIAVSASWDNTLKVWEVGSGRELRTLAGHTSAVCGVALSGHGRIAVSASYDNTLKVWEVGSGRELRTLAGHTSEVYGVALSGDGRIAVSASYDNTLKVWEVGSGRELRTLAGHTSSVNGVALSGDGRIAVSASSDHTLKVWEVGSGRELRTLAGHTSAVYGVALSGDGRIAVSASYDNTLEVWEVGSGRELRTLAGHASAVYGVALSGDGRIAVSASWDNTLKVWEVGSGRELRTLAGHASAVYGVALSGHGRIAVSASYDNTLKVWEVGSGRELRTLAGHTSEVYGVALSGDGRIAVSASYDNTLKVWEVGSGRELRTLAGHTSSVNGVALSGDGRIAVSASSDHTLKVWEVGSGRELRTLAGHTSAVYGVALSGDGRIAVSASYDNTLEVWEVGSGRELRTLAGHASAVYGVALSGDGRIAVSASRDKTLKVWEVGSGRELRTLAGHTSAVRGVALSGDGRIAVSASRDNTLKVWEVGSGRELRTLAGHTSAVYGVALGADGRIAVSASSDHTLKVWEADAGNVLATFTCDSAAYCCEYSEALQLIVAGDAGGHLHFLRFEEPTPRK